MMHQFCGKANLISLLSLTAWLCCLAFEDCKPSVSSHALITVLSALHASGEKIIFREINETDCSTSDEVVEQSSKTMFEIETIVGTVGSDDCCEFTHFSKAFTLFIKEVCSALN